MVLSAGQPFAGWNESKTASTRDSMDCDFMYSSGWMQNATGPKITPLFMRKKVTVVGGGFVGSTTAQRIVDLESQQCF